MITPLDHQRTHKVCSQCGERKPIDQFYRRHADQEQRHCECRECRNLLSRERKQNQRLQRTKQAVPHARTARGLLDAARRLAAECGGWDKVNEELRPADRARLVMKLVVMAEEEQLRAEQAWREAKVSLKAPGMQRELSRVGAQYLREHPAELEPFLPGIIRSKPSLLVEALQDGTVVGTLKRMGWTIERPDPLEAVPQTAVSSVR